MYPSRLDTSRSQRWITTGKTFGARAADRRPSDRHRTAVVVRVAAPPDLAACPCVGDIDLTPGEAETLVSIARGSHQCLHTRDLVNLNLFRLIMTRGTMTFEATPLGQAWSRRHTEAPTSSSCVATPAARPLGRWKMWTGRWPPIGGARPRPSPSAGGGDRANAEVGEAPRRFSILAKEARQFEVCSRRTPGRSSVPGSTNRPPFQAGS